MFKRILFRYILPDRFICILNSYLLSRTILFGRPPAVGDTHLGPPCQFVGVFGVCHRSLSAPHGHIAAFVQTCLPNGALSRLTTRILSLQSPKMVILTWLIIKNVLAALSCAVLVKNAHSIRRIPWQLCCHGFPGR